MPRFKKSNFNLLLTGLAKEVPETIKNEKTRARVEITDVRNGKMV